MKKQIYWNFLQNNSGGSFKVDDKLCHRLFIEAHNETKAIEIAVNLGVYFNGVDDGVDCSCCGDRWSSPFEIEIPYRYGTLSEEEAQKIQKKYNAPYEKTTWKFMGTEEPDPNRYDAIFQDIEDYAQYLADRFNTFSKIGSVEARIFYANGRIKEIKPIKEQGI